MTQETKVLFGIGGITVAILLGAVFFLSKTPPISGNGSVVDNNLLIKENSWKIATDSAKVTIVEFGDYQCPACGASYPVIEQILKDYPKKVNFVFRHFPLPLHLNSLEAAEAAEAAGEQGKYWQMHELLYKNQSDWSESKAVLEIFINYAKELGLNIDLFKSSMSSNKFIDKINSDKNDGTSLGINSTPTFFVNGTRLNNWSYNEFKKYIENVK